jgi:hypothetical protein
MQKKAAVSNSIAYLDGILDVVNIQEYLGSTTNTELSLWNFLDDAAPGKHLAIDFEHEEVLLWGTNEVFFGKLPVEDSAVKFGSCGGTT